ncbi:tetratricopeptide repeat protein [Candidatus Saccharibacteria bacterium]|nr:tetratricopeptide repeat protein [Candidatus Saccharibacteria bacterium]
MTPTELYNHISEAEGIPMQELNPLQFELMQIAEEAMVLRVAREDSQNQIPEAIFNKSNEAASDQQRLEKISALRGIANEVIGHALNTVNAIKESPPEKLSALVDAAEAIARLGDGDRALQLVESIIDSQYKSVAVSRIAAITRNPDMISRAIILVNTLPDGLDRTRALGEIAVNIASAGEYDQAITTVVSLTDWYERSIALEKISVIIAQNGDIQRGLTLSDKINNPIDKDRAKSIIAETMAQSGDIDSALKLLDSLESSVSKTNAILELIHIIAQSGDIERATQLSNDLSTNSSRDVAQQFIAEAYARRGDVDRALELIKHMLSAHIMTMTLARVGTIADSPGIISQAVKLMPREDGLIGIAAITHDPSIIDKALQAAGIQGNPVYRSRELAAITPIIAKAGDISRALTITKQIEQPYHRAQAYLSIAQIFIDQVDALEQGSS